MRTKLSLMLAALLIPLTLFAQFNQWTPESGIPVRTTAEVEFARGLATNSAGQSLVAWTEFVQPDRNLYAMLLDSEGNQLWDEAVLLCDAVGMQEQPAIIALNDNEWGIAFYDYRDFPTVAHDTEVYYQKIDNQGNLFFPEGLHLGDGYSDYDFPPIIFNDGTGGCIVTWINQNDESTDIYAQKIDSDGTFQWSDGGLHVADGPGTQGYTLPGYFEAISDDNGGAIIGYIHYTDHMYQHVCLQRVNADGDLLWSEGSENHFFVAQSNNNYADLDIASDGNGGVYVVWSIFNWSPDQGSVRMQRLDSMGNLYWNVDGLLVDFSDDYSIYEPQIVEANNNEAIVTFKLASNSQDDQMIKMQKVGGDTAPVLHWNNGQSLVLTETEEYLLDLEMIPDGSGGFYASWRLNDTSQLWDDRLLLQHINSDGAALWTGYEHNGVVYHENTDYPNSTISLLPDGAISSAWIKESDGGKGVQFQIISHLGLLTLGENGLIVRSDINNNAQHKSIISTESGSYIGWMDYRGNNTIPYVQKLDENGNEQFSQNGVCLLPGEISYSPGMMYLFNMEFCSDNQDGLYMAMTYKTNTFMSKLLLQHLNSEGEILWGDSGFIINDDDLTEQELLSIHCLENGNLVAIFLEFDTHYEGAKKIKAMCFDSDHNTVWDEPIILPRNNISINHHAFDSFQMDDNSIYIAYDVSYSTGHKALDLDKLNTDGTLAWDNPVELQENYDNRRLSSLDISAMGENIAVAWSYDYVTSDNDINITLVEPDGDFIWDPEIVQVENIPAEIEKILLKSYDNASNSCWIFWTSVSGDSAGHSIKTQRVDVNGEFLLEDWEGLLLDVGSYNTYCDDILVLDDNSVYLVWTKDVYANDTDIKYTHLDETGNVVNSGTPYPEDHATLCGENSYQFNADIIQSGASSFIAVWYDARGYMNQVRYNLYTQKVDDGYTGITDIQQPVPLSHSIAKTWPNPFNPSINISYQLADRSNVKITVYDMLGREVAVLLDKQMNAGKHHILWDAGNSNGNPVATGTYFLRMETAEKQDVRKITLIK